jgi:hypothetical protein
LWSIRAYNLSCFFRVSYLYFRAKFEFYNVNWQSKGCCSLSLWFTLILSGQTLVVGFVEIEIISFLLYLITLPSWRGYLDENLRPAWAIFSISLATIFFIVCFGYWLKKYGTTLLGDHFFLLCWIFLVKRSLSC